MNPTDPIETWMSASPLTLEETATVEQADVLLRDHGIRHLPITKEGKLVGLISERDLFVAARFAETRGLALAIIMAPGPYAVAPNATLEEVARGLFAKKEGAAVIVDQGRIVGVFTAVDALRALAGASREPLPRRPSA